MILRSVYARARPGLKPRAAEGNHKPEMVVATLVVPMVLMTF